MAYEFIYSSQSMTKISMIETLTTDYILFDLDGTLVDSTHAVEATWNDVLKTHNEKHVELPPLDPITFLKVSHGHRTQETFEQYFPYLPSSNDDIDEFEASIASNYGHFAKPVNGASDLLLKLNEQHDQKRWAIVTSGTRKLAHGWVDRVFSHVARPAVFITANDVENGKPNPEGYNKAFASLVALNSAPENSRAVVFEDAPTGIKAGVNGGFTVIGIATTFPKDVLIDAGATYVIQDLTAVSLVNDENNRIQLSLSTL